MLYLPLYHAIIICHILGGKFNGRQRRRTMIDLHNQNPVIAVQQAVSWKKSKKEKEERSLARDGKVVCINFIF